MIMSAIMKCPRVTGSSSVTNAQIRQWIRHPLRKHKIARVSQKVVLAITALAKQKLVRIEDEAEDDAAVPEKDDGDEAGEPAVQDDGKRVGGWPKITFSKRPWSEVAADDDSLQAVTRLRLSAANFEP